MNLEKIIKAFKDNYQLFYVGGFVRAKFTSEEHSDIDMATDALPKEMIELCLKEGLNFWTTKNGIAHGTVVIEEFEITTFRKDVSCDGRNATVEFAKTIQEDLSRRDFTCNSMAIDCFSGEFLDPFGGGEDIKNKLIRAVGDPKERLQEDILRALRAVRFANQLGFDIEITLQQAIYDCDISNISQERIREELIKTFKTQKFYYMLVLNMIDKIIPEIKEIRNLDGGDKHNETVDKHSMVCLERMMELTDNPILMLTALLHDLGKGRTKDNPERIFKGHEEIGAEMAQVIMERLKFPTDDIKYATTMIQEHMRWHMHSGKLSNKALRKAIAVIGEDNIMDMLKLVWCDEKANLANKYISEFEWHENPIWLQYQKMKQTDIAMKVTDLSIGGNELIEIGFTPGPRFSEILESCLDRVSDGMTNDRETLTNYVKELMQEAINQDEKV